MTERDILRTIAKLAVKHKRKRLYLWCVKQNQRSLHRQWAKEKGRSAKVAQQVSNV